MSEQGNQKRNDGELTHAQYRYVEALASGMGLTEAAQAAGITTRTGRNWRNAPQVQAALRHARQDRLADATSIATAMMSDALDTLKSVMLDTDAPYTARVSAARVILETAVEFNKTLDFAERLAAVEARQ